MIIQNIKPYIIFLPLLILLLTAAGCGGGDSSDSGDNNQVDDSDQAISGEIIPSDRRIDWSPGIPGGIPNYPVGVDVTDYGAVGDGVTDDTVAIQNAINNCPVGQVVYLPSGTYRTTSYLSITKGIVLRGNGPNNTKIKFERSGWGNAIRISGNGGVGSNISIISGFTKGSTSIVVENASTISTGDFIAVFQDNEAGLVNPAGSSGTCTWCGFESDENHSMSQIVKVTGKNGNTLTLNRPLYYTFQSIYNPEIKEISMVENAGVEDLYVERALDGSGANIYLLSTAGSWVKNVESYKTAENHILLRRSYGCEIRDSYIHHAYSYGGGGEGYGIDLFGANSDHLIENNILDYLRHAMSIRGGGSGNVFGYNYSRDPYDSDSGSWLSHDAMSHGSHPYMNLWESNVFAKFNPDYTWGSSSHHTVFRNFITTDRSFSTTIGIRAVDIQAYNYYTNVIGNILGKPNISFDYYEDSGTKNNNYKYIYTFGYTSAGDTTSDDSESKNTSLLHGNYDYADNEIKWDPGISAQTLPNSYYLISKPAFFGNNPWPVIGPDLSPMVGTLPAKERYEQL